MHESGPIAFVGAGNMGEAIIRGILAGEALPAGQIRASDRREARRDAVAVRHGIHTCASNTDAVRGARVVVMAVKPQILLPVLEEIAPAIDPGALVISVAAGVRIAAIEARLPEGTRVVRAMPNMPCLVGEGATAIAGGAHAVERDLEVARAIFSAVGLVVTVDEPLLDAVTGLSGSGPAYIFMVVEALSDAGVKVGLSRWDAHALACQTVLGAAKLVRETEEHPGRLKDMVCSPGGTAIAAVHTLEAGGLRTTLINAVEVATRRSRELGGGEG